MAIACLLKLNSNDVEGVELEWIIYFVIFLSLSRRLLRSIIESIKHFLSFQHFELQFLWKYFDNKCIQPV